MMEPTIRILAGESNKKGDLFTRLMRDLFFTLGYDNLRLDVHKTGRELDLLGDHRVERRRVAAECKAQAGKIGGGDINKFLGSLVREQTRCGNAPIAGYFVALGGFTEAAVEQERESGGRVVLLDGCRVIEELERSRAIVSRVSAAERAGHCAQAAKVADAQLTDLELLGHSSGYLWALIYSRGKEPTHFALIHADGTALSSRAAQEILDLDRHAGGKLHSLRYIAPPGPPPGRAELLSRSLEHHRHWIAEDFGFIHLDGLPADTDLSATRLKLERLFVPLRARKLSKKGSHSAEDSSQPIGQFLSPSVHLALLAQPGGGKTTLLKRLATAYAFPDRRTEVPDQLPDFDWLPLVLRCRELRDRANRPILELLEDLPKNSGMDEHERGAFCEHVHEVLRQGRALLLIDGLDELAEEAARQAFARRLRTFVATFPQVALVVTSRPAGFRLVAGTVAGICSQAQLAPLDERDVRRLCEHWHIEVVGDSEKVRQDAQELGAAIWRDRRIRSLAESPLLLTTLLVVKRWIGELPRSRAQLYREAIRVLVRTWNIEGYAPLDEDETMAQLSYVACAMLQDGVQQIGQRRLMSLLQTAHRELEAELHFARVSPTEFIERIEYRSSLLMQTGVVEIEGVIEPVYEFRHLTFQEYLAARGYVEEQYPGRAAGKNLTELLEPHFEHEGWREAIALAAALAGRKAEDLIRRLTLSCQANATPAGQFSDFSARRRLHRLLHQCICDEVQVSPSTLRQALLVLAATRAWAGPGTASLVTILRGKFGAVFRDLVEQQYLSGGEGIERYISAMSEISAETWRRDDRRGSTAHFIDELLRAVSEGERITRIRAAFACARRINRVWADGEAKRSHPSFLFRYVAFVSPLLSMVSPEDIPSTLAACRALALLAGRGHIGAPAPETILWLYKTWRAISAPVWKLYPAWALLNQELLPPDTFASEYWDDCDDFLVRAVRRRSSRHGASAALVVGWYRRAPWSDSELADQISRLGRSRYVLGERALRSILNTLGEPGVRAAAEWDRVRAQGVLLLRTPSP